jgi:hypothetical protein
MYCSSYSNTGVLQSRPDGIGSGEAHGNQPWWLSSWASSPPRSRGAELGARSRAAVASRILASAAGEVGRGV